MSEMMGRPRRKQYDREYGTEWRLERDWLAEHGFEPTFVKRVGDGIERYKYKKTAALFECVALFYSVQESARKWLQVQQDIAERGTVVDAACDVFDAKSIANAIDKAAMEDDTL